MSRKRTHEVAFSEPVTVPFKKRIPAGHANFTIEVPKSYSDMRFFFSSFYITPDFYSTEAALEELEDPEEAETPILFDMGVKNVYPKKADFYPGTFELDKAVTKTAQVMTKVNAFFEGHKPQICLSLGTFFDWTDKRFDADEETWDEFMEIMAMEYYGEALDKTKHYNALPLSARSIPLVNNYLFPTLEIENVRENISFRLWMAPNTGTNFSTDGHLRAMGFTPKQIGKRSGQKKFVFKNQLYAHFEVVRAQNAPQFDIPQESLKNLLKIDLRALTSVFIPTEIKMEMKKKDSFKNENYATAMKKAMQDLSACTNTRVNVNYDEATKKFKFIFPPNPDVLRTTITLPTDLAERLGFGLVDSINRDRTEGDRVDDDFDITKTETKARALGYDTGMILVTNESKTSNTLIGISDQLMCTVYPNAVGVYSISPLENCFEPPTMSLPNFFSGGQNDVSVPYKLYRFLDNNEPAKLDWKNGAFVCGQLRGLKPDQQL